MFINKVFIFAIVVSFVVVGHIQTTTADDIILKKFLGKWYNLGIITDSPDFEIRSCSQMTATETDDPQAVEVVTTTKHEGMTCSKVTKVEFLRTEIRFTDKSARKVLHTKVVKNMNNNKELIFGNTVGGSFVYYQLISRYNTSSQQSVKIMEEIAVMKDLKIQWIDQSNCS